MTEIYLGNPPEHIKRWIEDHSSAPEIKMPYNSGTWTIRFENLDFSQCSDEEKEELEQRLNAQAGDYHFAMNIPGEVDLPGAIIYNAYIFTKVPVRWDPDFREFYDENDNYVGEFISFGKDGYNGTTRQCWCTNGVSFRMMHSDNEENATVITENDDNILSLPVTGKMYVTWSPN